VLLAGNAGEVLFAIIASAITGRIPLNARQLLLSVGALDRLGVDHGRRRPWITPVAQRVAVRTGRGGASTTRCATAITLVWADGGYAGRLVRWSKYVVHLTVQIVKRKEGTSGFAVLPRRWVVERTFASDL
jgi:hypothetical protein